MRPMKSVAVKLLVIAAFVAAPFVQTNGYWLHVFCVALIGAILALGLQLLVGMAGLLSLGQAAFYGIGAYVSAVLTLAFWYAVSDRVCSRRRGRRAQQLAVGPDRAAARLQPRGGDARLQYHHLSRLAQRGLGDRRKLRPDECAGAAHFRITQFTSERSMYFLCLLVAAVVYLAMDRLVHSRFGRALKAISQDEDAARACGISINLYKSKCFLVAAFAAGSQVLSMRIKRVISTPTISPSTSRSKF